MKQLVKSLSLGLLVIGGTPLQSFAEGSSPEDTVCLDTSSENSSIRTRILQQLRNLDFMLEGLGQAINNYRVKVSDKKAVIAYLLQARASLQGLIKEEGSFTTCSLLYRNRKLTDCIAVALETDFATMQEPSYAIDENEVEQIDSNSIEAELAHRDSRIDLLTNYSEVLGLSYLNVFSRSLSEFSKEHGISEAFTRALPYIGWTAYYKLFLAPRAAAATANSVEAAVKAAGLQAQNKKLNYREMTASLAEAAKDAAQARGITAKDQQLTRLQGLAALETVPTINLGIGLALSGIIQKDLKDLYGFASQCSNRFIAYCKGELYDDGSGYRKPIAKFTDIIGAHRAKAELNAIVDYFKDKRAIDRIGASIDRSYLLAGPLDTSKGLAHAVAGEITAVLKAQGRKSECSLIEVHASSLVQKSLKEVLKDAEKRAPCIVVLDEIDLIHHYGLRKIKCSVWSDIIGSMNSLLRSKKDVFVITTATTDTFAEPEALARYGVFSKVENPTYEDRHHFFKRELERRSIALGQFNLDLLAEKTSGYTFVEVMNVLKRACAEAHSNRTSLTQALLEKSIAAKDSRVPGSSISGLIGG